MIGDKMKFELSKKEKALLSNLQGGVSQIKIYESCGYPCRVTFVLLDGTSVTIGATEEHIFHKFEVNPASVSELQLCCDPKQIIDFNTGARPSAIFVLQKSDWVEGATDEEKVDLLGNPVGALSQSEGRAADIPENALGAVTFDAGVFIDFEHGESILVATSMFPFALYVSDCAFSEEADAEIYDHIRLFGGGE